MVSNYLKIALRNILKHRFFSIINLLGLTLGVACCLFIFLYVKHELSYDRFHVNAENIYRAGLIGRIAGQEIQTTTTCVPLGPAMQNEIPGIDKMTRLIPAAGGGDVTFRLDEKMFTEEKIFYADSNFFEFFTTEMLAGDPRTALQEPNSIVLTEGFAKKYFGTRDPLGKMIAVGNDKIECKVTGVCRDFPTHSHVRFNALIPFVTVEKDFFPGWTGNSIQTYIAKNPSTSMNEVNARLEDMVEKYVGQELEQGLGVTFEDFRKGGGIYRYFIYPMTDSHLYSNLQHDLEPAGEITYVYIFSGVGLFILVIACINFMNLSTARSAGRAKEVGLRKTLGSLRGQMVRQFLAESFIYGLAAVVLALALAYLLLPQFNQLAGKELSLTDLNDPAFLVAAGVLIFLVGILAGSYPAFYLTSFQPVEVLKGKLKAGMKSKGVRSSLVVMQFAISTFLIVATVVVYKQLTYMQNRNLGLDQHNLINVSNTRVLGEGRKAFKNSVEALAGVSGASYTNNAFPGMDNTTVMRKKELQQDFLTGLYSADWDHLDVMKLTLKEGRFFSREFGSDSLACVINEAAVREFGLENPIGAELIDFQNEKPDTLRVIGVVHDFNFESLRTDIRPIVIELSEQARNLVVRYEGDPTRIVSSLEELWKASAPGEPFQYTFVDQDFGRLFRAEMQLKDVFLAFTAIAIFIASLGLFALAAFTTEQRTKEIGIRKAMGASSIRLTLLLSREFTFLVLVAVVPALLAGWFLSGWWLNGFVYRVEMNPMIFVACGAASVLVAWITVAYQALKAAGTSPVTSLRYE
jgi:putative ABC transport system permease protein